jgi:O-antigen biosynthesis protein WbqV
MIRRKLSQQARGLSSWFALAHDLVLAALAMIVILVVRYHLEGKPLPDGLVLRSTVVFTLLCAVVFVVSRQHRGMWRFTNLNDVVRLTRSVVIADLILLPILFVTDRALDFPRSTILVIAVVLPVLLAFGRLLTHALSHGDVGAAFRFEDRSQPPAVIVGSAAAVSTYLTGVRRRRTPLRVAGIVTLDGAPFGRTIQGAEILGDLRRLRSILKALAAAEEREPQVVLAEPRPGRELMDTVVAAAGDAGAKVVRVRTERTGAATLSPVDAADLLDRPPRTLDRERARAMIAGKRVLVTGAGGTIGSELTRQALALGPARMILLDASEFNLYAIDQELHEAGHPHIWTAELGDVRDLARLEALFAREKPDVVLHAAALKHVPLMELNPPEAVLTNVGGAVNVARLARDHCEAMVFISTDKAVNPTNVMGATKRVAERCVQAVTRGGKVEASVVRFGNVLGSTGSVVPLFERQIARGGPLTVTHPDMLRYFMTVQEAASLVLQAGALPLSERKAGGDTATDEHGRIYVLDMGEPVRIDDLARQLIQLHGLRPQVDIGIEYSGLRPGEKLFEEIFYDAETVRQTSVDGVMAAFDPAPQWSALAGPVADLLAAATSREEAEVLRLLQVLEPAFKPG